MAGYIQHLRAVDCCRPQIDLGEVFRVDAEAEGFTVVLAGVEVYLRALERDGSRCGCDQTRRPGRTRRAGSGRTV
eukprot:13051390-Heterocapsa_arctica.AAC.1